MATLKKRRKLPQAEFTTPARDNQVRLRGATPAIPAVPQPRGIPAAPRAPRAVPPIPREEPGRPEDPGAQGRANAAAKKAENEIRRLMKRKK